MGKIVNVPFKHCGQPHILSLVVLLNFFWSEVPVNITFQLNYVPVLTPAGYELSVLCADAGSWPGQRSGGGVNVDTSQPIRERGQGVK